MFCLSKHIASPIPGSFIIRAVVSGAFGVLCTIIWSPPPAGKGLQIISGLNQRINKSKAFFLLLLLDHNYIICCYSFLNESQGLISIDWLRNIV